MSDELTTLSLYIENPDNPQTVTDQAFADLVRSIREMPETLAAAKIAYATDYVSPISGVDYSGKRVVMAGNKRLRALKKIRGELAQVPADWFFDLTPLGIDARRKWLVRSNIQTGEWDPELLAKLYSRDELADMMSAETLEGLLGKVADAAPDEGKTDEDAVPDVSEEEPPLSYKGAVYSLGDHRLMCGDSTSPSDVATLMAADKADLLITDPPYNVALGHVGSVYDARKLHRMTDGLLISNDDMPEEDFVAFLTKIYKSALEAMRPGAAFYVWYASTHALSFLRAAEAAGLQVRETLIWVKSSMSLGRQDYQWRHEICLYGWKDGAAHTWTTDRKQTTVIDLAGDHVERDGDKIRLNLEGRVFELPADAVAEIVDGTTIPVAKPSVNKVHPTMKPVALFAYQIGNSSRPGEVVLDLFGGSGTTAIACEQSHRRARLMELDPHFADVIRKRWAEFKYGEGCDWAALTPEV